MDSRKEWSPAVAAWRLERRRQRRRRVRRQRALAGALTSFAVASVVFTVVSGTGGELPRSSTAAK